MDIIFTLGIMAFSLSSWYFLIFSAKKFNTPFLVSVITLISYVIMYDGSFITFSDTGAELYWTRWLFYAFSCTLLIFGIARKLKKTPAEGLDRIDNELAAAIYLGLDLFTKVGFYLHFQFVKLK